MKLSVKNMVCPRCITAVEKILEDLHLNPLNIQLGEAVTGIQPDENQMAALKQKLKDAGFELIEDNKAQIIEKIKAVIVEKVHHLAESHIVFSELLSRELNRDYSALSKLFSANEGITIEQFIILQKIEKAKELLLYNELTLSEIAYMLGYSSVAHLSAQFRKTTGFTPTAFKKQGKNMRQPLDSITKKV
nr:AraC family transcriptional regulator [Flavobacterium sp. MK4S-17]